MAPHDPSGRQRPEDEDAFDDLFGDPDPAPAEDTADTADTVHPTDTLEVPPAASIPDEDVPTGEIPVHRRAASQPEVETAPADEDDQPTRIRSTLRDEAASPRDDDVARVPTGWWSTDPVTPDPQPHPRPVPYAGPHQPRPGQQGRPGMGRQGQPERYAPRAAPSGAGVSPRRSGLSPVAIVAVLVGGVLLGALVMLALLGLRGDDEEAAAPPRTVTASPSTPTSSGSSPASSSSSSTSSSPSSSSTTVQRTGRLPAGATSCAGPVEGTRVARGNDVTSCPFAESVRAAYLDEASGGSGAGVSVDVRSPVTDEEYTMRCTGGSVTLCTGGNNAVVYLY